MKLKDILGLGAESETARDGFLSSNSEKHAAVIGLFVGMTMGLVGGRDAAWLFLVLAGIGLGTRQSDVGHLEDVSKEPAYAFGAAMLSFLTTVFLLVPHLQGGVI